jgi:hypothetical protein
MCGLVRILEPAPAADIENQNDFVGNFVACNIVKQLLKPRSVFQQHTALSGIDISPNYYETVPGCIGLYCAFLVFNRVLLTVIGHAHILCGGNGVADGCWDAHLAPLS